jgi:hypothetical protein
LTTNYPHPFPFDASEDDVDRAGHKTCPEILEGLARRRGERRPTIRRGLRRAVIFSSRRTRVLLFGCV